jgi:PAS domain S-box-containing protein
LTTHDPSERSPDRRSSKREQAEGALRESEARLRLALQNAPITVFHQDRDLRYTWIHSLQVALPLDDIVGKTDADLVPPEHASKLSALKRRVLDGGNPLREEISVQVLGETRYYDCSVEPLRDAAGQIIGVTGATWDITERKQAEQTQVQLVAMLDATPGFVGFADAKDTHILYINPAGRNMVGVHPQEDVTQLKIADVIQSGRTGCFATRSSPRLFATAYGQANAPS